MSRQVCVLVQGVAEDELLRVACDALVYAAGTFRDRGTRLLTYAWYFIMRDLAAAIRLQACRLPSSTRVLSILYFMCMMKYLARPGGSRPPAGMPPASVLSTRALPVLCFMC